MLGHFLPFFSSLRCCVSFSSFFLVPCRLFVCGCVELCFSFFLLLSLLSIRLLREFFFVLSVAVSTRTAIGPSLPYFFPDAGEDSRRGKWTKETNKNIRSKQVGKKERYCASRDGKQKKVICPPFFFRVCSASGMRQIDARCFNECCNRQREDWQRQQE